MPAPEQVLYAMPAMRALVRAEAAALRSKVPSRAGSYGLRLAMHEGGDCPDAVAHWVRLRHRDNGWKGDIRADGDESLPFADDTFAIVWLSQVLQFRENGIALLREAARVTAPGGMLLVSGMHPVSAWAPWLHWSMRGAARCMRLRAPLQWARSLADLGLQVRGTDRFGQVLPRATDVGSMATLCGGGYLLVACKNHDAVTPLDNVRQSRKTRLQGRLAPGAHRECA